MVIVDPVLCREPRSEVTQLEGEKKGGERRKSTRMCSDALENEKYFRATGERYGGGARRRTWSESVPRVRELWNAQATPPGPPSSDERSSEKPREMFIIGIVGPLRSFLIRACTRPNLCEYALKQGEGEKEGPLYTYPFAWTCTLSLAIIPTILNRNFYTSGTATLRTTVAANRNFDLWTVRKIHKKRLKLWKISKSSGPRKV